MVCDNLRTSEGTQALKASQGSWMGKIWIPEVPSYLDLYGFDPKVFPLNLSVTFIDF